MNSLPYCMNTFLLRHSKQRFFLVLFVCGCMSVKLDVIESRFTQKASDSAVILYTLRAYNDLTSAALML